MLVKGTLKHVIIFSFILFQIHHILVMHFFGFNRHNVLWLLLWRNWTNSTNSTNKMHFGHKCYVIRSLQGVIHGHNNIWCGVCYNSNLVPLIILCWFYCIQVDSCNIYCKRDQSRQYSCDKIVDLQALNMIYECFTHLSTKNTTMILYSWDKSINFPLWYFSAIHEFQWITAKVSRCTRQNWLAT